MALTGCCGCFDLRGGSTAIAITFLVLTGIAVICNTSILVMADHDHPLKSPSSIAPTYAGCALSILFNVLLILGVKNESWGFLLAWLIYYGIGFGFFSVSAGVVLIFAFTSGVVFLYLVALFFAVLIAVLWYWFCVVLAFMKELKGGAAFDYKRQVV